VTSITTQPPPLPERFPADGTSAEKLRFVLGYAILAPSGHNTQPWRFAIDGDSLALRADRTRALPVVDPDDRELTMSCGAALALVRVALRRFGHDAVVEPLPDAADTDLLARATLGARVEPTRADHTLFEAIPKRRTIRAPFDPRDVEAEMVAELEELAAREGSWLAVIAPGERRHEVAALVDEGDRAQAADAAFRRELAAWFRPNRGASRDGIPGYAFGMSDLFSRVGAFVLRRFDWGKRQAAKDRGLLESAPLVAVLGTDRDEPRDWLAAGQALAYILLRARAEGVSASFLNQPIEVAELRPRLAAAIERPGRFPLLLLRLGYGGEQRPTPRRGVDEVLQGPRSPAS
jgi:nitroreductase